MNGSSSLFSKAFNSASASAAGKLSSLALSGTVLSWFVAAAIRFWPASDIWSRTGMFPRISSMPSATESYNRVIMSFLSSRSRISWPCVITLCERNALSSRLRQTSGSSRRSCRYCSRAVRLLRKNSLWNFITIRRRGKSRFRTDGYRDRSFW